MRITTSAKIVLGITFLLLLPHFIPLYSKTGQLDRGTMNLCMGYGSPVSHYHRIIPSGLDEYRQERQLFKATQLTDQGGILVGDIYCGEPVTLRLYLY